MRKGDGVGGSAVRALACCTLVAFACTSAVEHRSLRPTDPEQVWDREFARARRFESGRMFDEAERHYLRALDAGRSFALGDQRVLQTHLALADLYTVLGRVGDAEAQYVEVIGQQRVAYGDTNEATADSLNRLGVLFADDGRASEALPLFEESLRVRAVLYGPDHPSTVATLQNLAAAYHEVGRYEEAEKLYLRALEAYETQGEQYLGVASVAQNNLACLYRSMGRGSRAESLHLHAIALSIEINGPRNPNVAIFSRDLANLLAEQQRYRAAEARYKTAMQIFVASYGHTHAELRRTLLDYAAMLRAEGRDREAGKLEVSAVEIDEALRRARSGATPAPRSGGKLR
jgi:tetratricopeptide (TPR) repeat protein